MARRTVYSQNLAKPVFNGIEIKGLMDGTSYEIEEVGGEVDITEGTDGGGMNIATKQGVRCYITLRETSPSIDMLNAAREMQQIEPVSNSFVLQTGVKALLTITNAYVGRPDNLSSGDKKMGGLRYSIVGTDYVLS